jgi:hypothetical protein
MEEAARRLIIAIVRTIEKLSAADFNRRIEVLGRATTVGEMLEALQATRFTVTDRNPDTFNNNGVGAAERRADFNIDTINYEAIVGGSTDSGYADARFPDDAGMSALVLHEIAHLTLAGFEFFTASNDIFNDDHNKDALKFYNSEYARNLEAFSNAVMQQAANFANIPLHGVAPGSSVGIPSSPIAPEEIYSAHNGGAPYSG